MTDINRFICRGTEIVDLNVLKDLYLSTVIAMHLFISIFIIYNK